MAIVIPGKTECPACGEVHQENEELISFPALFPETHKYYYCSDAAFHVSCFNEWEHSEAALAKYEEYLGFYKNEKPDIPEGMEFSEFEKTNEYKTFIRNVEILLGKE